MTTLKKRNCDPVVIGMLEDSKGWVLARTIRMRLRKSDIPFIPVIPRTYLGIYGLVSLIRIEGQKGYTNVFPELMTDEEETSDLPYFIFGVDDGKDTRGMTSAAASELIRKKRRHPLTVDEGMAMCVHTNLLSAERTLSFIGSRYSFPEYEDVPTAFIMMSGCRPKLGTGHRSLMREDTYCPSCKRRF
jgi:hypothetical protein